MSSWTIEELANRVAEVLARDYAASPDNRVRGIPDLRSIRYYTTLGLLDRPTLHGRTAYYGARHLLQLAAIKRLQAERWPLAKIQRALLHMKDEELAKVARVQVEAIPQQRAPSEPAAANRPFWKESPAAFVSEVSEHEAHSAGPMNGALQGIELTGDVTLLVRAVRSLNDEDIQAIRAVAGPLLDLLQRRRLLDRAVLPTEKGTSHDPAAADPV
jgi:DNA-binding transcriptional MerR regulator